MMLQLFYYNGKSFEKMRRVIYVYQGLSGVGYKRIQYPKTKNVRGYRRSFDPPKTG